MAVLYDNVFVYFSVTLKDLLKGFTYLHLGRYTSTFFQ